MFLPYDFYSEFYSLSVLNIFYSTKHLYSFRLILAKTFLFTPFPFLYSLESLTRIDYILGYNPINSSIAMPPISSFILPTINAFESS